MLSMPEVIGWDLDDAVMEFKKAGLTYSIAETEPPRGVDGNYRPVVIRQSYDRENCFTELTIAMFKQRLE